MKFFHSTSVSQGSASSFLKYFHFVSLYILFHYISGRSIVCQYTKNTSFKDDLDSFRTIRSNAIQ